jgi:fructosamine-3-kinase
MEWLEQALRRILPLRPKERIRAVREARGGDIGRSYYVETTEHKWFVKYRTDLSALVFQREAEGLALLREAGAVAVPETVYAGEIPGRDGGMIVLAWIEPGPARRSTEEALGVGMAELHRKRSPDGRFGLHHDNYIGLLPQPNGWCGTWREFYRERRLLPMIRLAEERGRLPAERRRRLERLMDSLERWIPADCKPSLLHGDLWHGNRLAGADGRPYLIDPAVFYGDREYEMAFTELFGGFSSRFYAAYEEAYPLPPDYAERRPLYQLYYLLVHLILFGESYGPSVDRVSARYVG